MTPKANTPNDDSTDHPFDADDITVNGEPIGSIEFDADIDADTELRGPGVTEREFTGSFTLDLSHPDDIYRVDDAGRAADAPPRPRPCADPHVVFVHGDPRLPFTVMQDVTDMEAFIIGEPSAWTNLTEMA